MLWVLARAAFEAESGAADLFAVEIGLEAIVEDAGGLIDRISGVEGPKPSLLVVAEDFANH